MNFLLAIASIFRIIGGISAARAANREADAQREQADLQRVEAEREADRVAKVRKAQRAKVKMAFIKGGVEPLIDSPLLLFEEQKKEDVEEVAALRARGIALQRLGFQRAGIVESKGRAALIGGIGQAAGIASGISFGGGTSASATPSPVKSVKPIVK